MSNQRTVTQGNPRARQFSENRIIGGSAAPMGPGPVIITAVAGTVTANAGTDLNTSELALESGNLETIREDEDIIQLESTLSRRLLENIYFELVKQRQILSEILSR